MLTVGSVYLIVSDFEKSLDFYRQLLETDVSAQNKTRFAIFNAGGLCLCLLNGRYDAENPDKVVRAGEYDPLFDDYAAVTACRGGGKAVINL